MAKFMLILRSDITKDYSSFTPDQFGEILAKYQAWGEKLGASGNLQMGRKLTDEGGRVLTPTGQGTKATAKDGPYVETKEVVGGVYILDAKDYDHAAKMCEDHPNFLFGSIEIRQIDFMGGPEE
ncbi:MAG: YciI family protein [Planctomycetota bacterium]